MSDYVTPQTIKTNELSIDDEPIDVNDIKIQEDTDDNKSMLSPIKENLSVPDEENFFAVKSNTFRLGQPRIRTSFIETVDLLAIMESVSGKNLNLSPVRQTEKLSEKLITGLSLSDGEEKTGNSNLTSPKDKMEVVCIPRRKSTRISVDLTHDMRRISLHLHEKPVLKEGDVKDFYELKEVLGAGNFGKVRRALSKENGEEVAVKRIRKKKIDQVNRALLENEIRILRKIKHHSVVGLLDAYESPKYISMVMELCSGGDIFDWLDKEERLDEVRACAILVQIAAAVEYLHAKGVVHRDLKLENILIVKLDEAARKKPICVKIADFGFATTIAKPNELINGTCGSLNYVAPEVLSGKPYTKACDNWSVGVILYAMLGGYLPFYVEPEDGGRAKTFRNIQKGDYDYDDPDWEKVGELAKSVVNGLLTVKVSSRLTCKQLANHRWVRLRSSTAK